ncbi:hypothetical protein DSECCO2_652680 [anaerobic digester metagenome]
MLLGIDCHFICNLVIQGYFVAFAPYNGQFNGISLRLPRHRKTGCVEGCRHPPPSSMLLHARTWRIIWMKSDSCRCAHPYRFFYRVKGHINVDYSRLSAEQVSGTRRLLPWSRKRSSWHFRGVLIPPSVSPSCASTTGLTRSSPLPSTWASPRRRLSGQQRRAGCLQITTTPSMRRRSTSRSASSPR